MEKKSNPETPQKSKKLPLWRLALTTLALLIWVIVVIIACQYVITFGLYFLVGLERLKLPVWTTICNALIYAVATFLIIYVPVKFFKKPRLSRTDLGLTGLPTWTDILLAPVGFVIYLLLAAALIAIFSHFPFFDASQTQELGYHLTSGLDRVVAFFALCLIAPVAEELIFRGWLYAKLRALLPGKRLSLILSCLLVSLAFALLHGQWNVGVNVFAMSLVLCGLREVTGTIYSGILLHILKNTIAFVLVYLVGFGG